MCSNTKGKMYMTLFSWFRQSHNNNEQGLQTKKSLTLDNKSKWPIAKVEMTTQPIITNKQQPKDDSDIDGYLIKPDL
jgi:hypothetical protein